MGGTGVDDGVGWDEVMVLFEDGVEALLLCGDGGVIGAGHVGVDASEFDGGGVC